MAAFERVAVVSHGLADLADVPNDRRVVIGNGTDPQVIRPGPWPERPVIGLVSGASPGRGIELLIEAVRLARQEEPRAQPSPSAWAAATAPRETTRRHSAGSRSRRVGAHHLVALP